MKTTISVPDETLEQVDRWARTLGVNRSQFFTQAAERYLRVLGDDLTERINAALDAGGEDDELVRDVTAQGRRMLLATDDDW